MHRHNNRSSSSKSSSISSVPVHLIGHCRDHRILTLHPLPMKLLILSDLHLEFAPFEPVPGLEFDIVILAGIFTLQLSAPSNGRLSASRTSQ